MLGTDGFGRSDVRRKLRQFLRGGSLLRLCGSAAGPGKHGSDLLDPRGGGHRQVWDRSGEGESRDDLTSGESLAASFGEEGQEDALAREVEVRVPDIGDFEQVEVVEILVGPGDPVEVEDSLVSLESDKATMEIPSPCAGTIVDLKIEVGDRVSEGSPLLTLSTAERPAEASEETRSDVVDEDAVAAVLVPPEPEAAERHQRSEVAGAVIEEVSSVGAPPGSGPLPHAGPPGPTLRQGTRRGPAEHRGPGTPRSHPGGRREAAGETAAGGGRGSGFLFCLAGDPVRRGGHQ